MNRTVTLALAFLVGIIVSSRAVQAQMLRLEVQPTTLETWISNPNALPIQMDSYQISSNMGLLDSLSWQSIDDSAAANPGGVTAALGIGALNFTELGGLNAFFIGETESSGFGTWQAGTRWSIGYPFDSLPDPQQTTFQYTNPASSPVTGDVVIIPEPATGVLAAIVLIGWFVSGRRRR
jgi:hypothetical protein